MRFHCGLSFRPRFKLKWLLIFGGGLLALFSNILMVDASSTSLDIYPYSMYYYSNTMQSPIYKDPYNTTSTQYYYAITNQGSNSFNFNLLYNNLQDICPSKKANVSFYVAMTDSNGNIPYGLNFQFGYYPTGTATGRILESSNGYARIQFDNADLTQILRIVANNSNQAAITNFVVQKELTFECLNSESSDIMNNATINSNNIINNQNENTQDIIDNQNQNTQDIIDNQNANSQALIDSNKVCTSISSTNTITNGYFNSNGNITDDNSHKITPFIRISQTSIIKETINNVDNSRFCFYNSDKVLISCVSPNDYSVGQSITIPSSSNFVRFTINISSNRPQYEICDNGNQALADSQQQLNDSLTNANVSGAITEGDNLFTDTDVSDPIGLTSIVTAPIRLFQKLLDGSSCDPYSFSISLPGFTSKTVSLPSGCILWNNVPSPIIALYYISVYGILGYRLLVDMFHFVNSLRDPDKKNDYTLDL